MTGENLRESGSCNDLRPAVDNRGPRQGGDAGQLAHMMTIPPSGMVDGKAARVGGECRVDAVARGEVTRRSGGRAESPRHHRRWPVGTSARWAVVRVPRLLPARG
jgi:hypothetical protein